LDNHTHLLNSNGYDRHRQICHLKKERTASREEERRQRFTDPKRENPRTDLD
jgi:hypothetical protein